MSIEDGNKAELRSGDTGMEVFKFLIILQNISHIYSFSTDA